MKRFQILVNKNESSHVHTLHFLFFSNRSTKKARGIMYYFGIKSKTTLVNENITELY